jgi:type I restriction enzyme R subunit
LIAFERFVKENPDHIEALSLLLDRPEDFHTKELTDLRRKLAGRPEKFTEDNLRKAYHNELADIISIVKHAARGEPLLSAQERVQRAITKIKQGKKFTPIQEKWLDMIADHLLKNIVIDKPDFAAIPFSRHGGWVKANQVFEGSLAPLFQSVYLEMVK